MKAGFAETDITPPVGTHKIGWLEDIVSGSVLDPLFARAAVFESEGSSAAVIQLDVLCVTGSLASRIREGVGKEHGFPGSRIMVAATHNHAGPAVANVGDVRRDERYTEWMIGRIVSVFGRALASASEVELGRGRAFDFSISHNRRVVMRDGTVRTHGSLNDPQVLHIEGPIDPEVGVVAARGKDGNLLGMLVNFACHPTDHGGDEVLTAGFPGVLAREMRSSGCPVTMFLNGAAGNISTERTMEETGRKLADCAVRAIENAVFRGDVAVRCASRRIGLPYREITDEEVRGAARGAQRFIDSAIYDREIPAMVERIRAEGKAMTEVQALFLGDLVMAALPGEIFVQLGLRFKEEAHPRPAWVVSCANGEVGYVPHREAFARGGYETTFGPPSFLAPEAGDLLVSTALDLI